MKLILSCLLVLEVTLKIHCQPYLNPTTLDNNRYAFELYSELIKNPKNLIFSPFSISTALAMTYAGARSETKTEIGKVLHFNSDLAKFNSEFGQLLKKVQASQQGVQFDLANSLWAQNDYWFLDNYFKLVTLNYGAEIENVDFKNAKEREKSRLKINYWVKTRTHDKIKDLVNPSDLDSLTRLVLVNAIYFSGDWKYKFDSRLTKDDSFHSSADVTSRIPFMKQQVNLKYFENENLQAIEIPYTGPRFAMVIILPKSNTGLPGLEKTLTFEYYKALSDSMALSEIMLNIPKFTYNQSYELIPTFRELGMKLPFTLNADFSGMTGYKNSLYISQIVHKAFISVTETGTETAAATAVFLRAISSRQPGTPKVFKADHPFIFLIRDNETGSILFLGRMINPV